MKFFLILKVVKSLAVKFPKYIIGIFKSEYINQKYKDLNYTQYYEKKYEIDKKMDRKSRFNMAIEKLEKFREKFDLNNEFSESSYNFFFQGWSHDENSKLFLKIFGTKYLLPEMMNLNKISQKSKSQDDQKIIFKVLKHL